MIHAYAVGHKPPDPRAPGDLSTYISGVEAPESQVLSAVGEQTAVPVEYIKHFPLDFPTLSTSDPVAGVAAVARRYADCERCHLSAQRNRICHIKGNPHATVLAVGEGPGGSEDRAGTCFVGPSGRLQDELFAEAGIDPLQHIAWINLVGCRPCDTRRDPDRKPTLVEKLACSERTLMLMQAIRPRVVLCLGEEATALFWDKPPKPNTWHTLRPRDHPDDWIVVGVARHPAYLLRAIMARYQEYFAAKLFYARLRKRLPELAKVSAWRFRPRYLRTELPVVQFAKAG